MARPTPPKDGTEFNLSLIISELRNNEPYEREGRTAKTLVHMDDMRVVLVVMKEGSKMAEHDANATATVHTLQGEISLKLPRGEVSVPDGQLLALGAGLPHDVTAVSDAAFLLTLGWNK